MQIILRALTIFTLLFTSLILTTPAFAADLRSNETISIPASDNALHDPYLFGGTITIEAPVENDLVTAGGDITINTNVSGSVIAAGGKINLKGTVGNTARVAGGEVHVDAKITRDLIAAGGKVYVNSDASVNGDVVANGGEVRIEGPVKGKVVVNGGTVYINTTVGKNVAGNMGELHLGPKAVINGDLDYSASQKATIDAGASIKGQEKFTQRKEDEHTKQMFDQFFRAATFYKLLTDIILSILFILFFGRFSQKIIGRMTAEPGKNGIIGFIYILLWPTLTIFLFLLLWLGFASLLFYIFTFIIGLFLLKIFLGWFVINWYYNNQKQTYLLDWKAGLIGPLVIFLLMLIPVLGWFTMAIVFFIAIGAVMQEAVVMLKGQKIEKKIVTKKK